MQKLILSTLLIFFITSGYAQLIRGPYLQAATPTSIVIRWRTDVPTTSRVQFGNSFTALNQSIDDNNAVTDHEIIVNGLSPQTRYFYSVGSTSATYQGDADNFFMTTPSSGTLGKYRFGVLGDCGVNSAIQGNVRDRLAEYLGDNYMNALLLLGDNAYSFGTDPEYQSGFFNHYKGNFLKRTPLYPTPGNHDYNNDTFDRQNDHKIPYFDIFTMPAHGEAGGVPSGTESYYSYDYGNVHFLSLDSYGREDQATRLYDTLGKQVQWLKADLAANTNKGWVVAYWHHPPYSQGSRNSETDPEMTAIRENFIRILERSGVDLILCGHSHVYERTKLIKGHYDKKNTFDAAVHNISQSSGKYDGSDNSCPYMKTSSALRGTVYVVTGSAGQLGAPSAGWPHNAMYYADYEHGGSMLLEVEGNRLDAKWINADGQIRDKFTIEKDVNLEKIMTIEKGNSIDLKASFIGQYLWNTGATSQTLTVSPATDTEYKVKDSQNCISDVFRINVTNPLPVKLISFESSVSAAKIISIKWTTEMEHDFSHFQIERSVNGKEFTEIGRVNGKQNSSQKENYEFKDEMSVDIALKDTIYYRLKMIDLSSKFEYSRIIAVKLNLIILATDPLHTPVDIEIIPNPATPEDVRIRLKGKEKSVTNLTLTNISGQILSDQIIELSKNPIPFLPSGITAGIYFVKVVIDGKTITKKFVIL